MSQIARWSAAVAGMTVLAGAGLTAASGPAAASDRAPGMCASGYVSSGTPDYADRGDPTAERVIARYERYLAGRSWAGPRFRAVTSWTEPVGADDRQVSYFGADGQTVARLRVHRYGPADWRADGTAECTAGPGH